jgi:cell division septum initiation protein DivIVA
VNLPKSSIIDDIADHRDELLNENRKLNQRIKRLEEAGNNLLWNFCPEYTSDFTQSQSDALKQWNKAKEAKS